MELNLTILFNSKAKYSKFDNLKMLHGKHHLQKASFNQYKLVLNKIETTFTDKKDFVHHYEDMAKTMLYQKYLLQMFITWKQLLWMKIKDIDKSNKLLSKTKQLQQ